ncbi:MAG: sulfatase-like hydrolase/transferase [Acidobacteria bacterium]|nr:sulfatase-like hydrolase/transferase [Acidobacteriota bacterium]
MSRPLRFTFIIFLAALSTTLAAVGGWRFARASAPVSGPIIVISIDTLRADHLPAYGYTRVKTPAIDALAADGVVFERAYSHAPQTLPAHAALLSGQLPFESGVRDNVGFTIKPGERLLPQMLRERGFTTAGVVSSYVLRKDTGIAQGFDFFDAEMPAASPELSIGQVQRDGGESERIAERWLDSIGTARAFLFLHLYEPHKPYAPPERFSGYAPYDGEIAYADEIVGRLVKYLKSHQLYDRSTVILLSDHGEGLGDHGEQEHGLFVYDEAIHVPLIVKQESNVGAGRRVAAVVQHIDLVPTILDFVKAPVPGGLHGRSLKPVLEESGTLPPATVYSEALYARYHFGWSELTAITDDRYRYIKAPREELYDLQHDPREQANIATARPQPRQALRGALDRVAAGAPLHVPHDVPGEARERLQSLGYVGGQSGIAPEPGESLPDPKDKRQVLEQYREAVDLAAARRWPQAIALLQQILRDDAGMADVWAQLAIFAMAADVSAPADRRARAAAHEMLARIALARHDPDEAREEARLAREADPALPLPLFVEARLLYDEGRYQDALPLFEQAIAELKKPGALQIAELHFHTADTLARLERSEEAEAEFVEELKYFPQNTRARAGLAMLYQAGDRFDEAETVLGDMTRITPTPESYALAARLYSMFGNRKRAEAIRAESRRTFPPVKAPARVSRN